MNRLLLLGVLAFVATSATCANAATLTSPPTVVFGKVVHLGQGLSYQVYKGQLLLQFVREDDPGHVITLKATLGRLGPAGEFSYRLEIPRKYQPADFERSSSFEIGSTRIDYRMLQASVDGMPALAPDVSHVWHQASFANRAPEHRLDLRINLPQTDSDGDGMPDAWEEQYGLNRHLKSDATGDLDGDGIQNLEEFRRGTDPTLPDTTPRIQTKSLVVPAGGIAGFHAAIIDTDTLPGDLDVVFASIPDGLRIQQGDAVLEDGATVGYAAILAGQVAVQVDRSFQSGILRLEAREHPAPAKGTSAMIPVTAFSPASMAPSVPALWLDAASIPAAGPVAEWIDQSHFGRDAFQPVSGRQPLFRTADSAGIRFSSESYLYLDDRQLDLSSFTAFLALQPDAPLERDQVILQSGSLRARIGGTGNATIAGSLAISHGDREIRTPVRSPSSFHSLTVGGNGLSTFLNLGGAGFVTSRTGQSTESIAPSFASIGGADLPDGKPNPFFNGHLYEIVLFDRDLAPAMRARVEDYLQSRWSDRFVWDFEEQLVPITARGHRERPNALSGGWADDVLIGGDGPDILRGGPGNDRLTGGPGPDRFQFFKDQGDDTVTDFAPQSGDTLDLTGIFGQVFGDPGQYVTIRQTIVREAAGPPRVDTVLELDYDGAAGGRAVHQTLRLENHALSQTLLARIVNERLLLLGGPQFESPIELSARTPVILENGLPHVVSVKRSAHLDASIDVDLSFTGGARITADYAVSLDPSGSVSIRTLRFERGQAEASFTITAMRDFIPETNHIVITILADPRLAVGERAVLDLPLVDLPRFAIRTRQHVVHGPNGHSGIVVATRSGPGLEDPARIRLMSAGLNGADLGDSDLPEFIEFPPRVAEIQLTIPPSQSPSGESDIRLQRLWLVPDAATQAVSAGGVAFLLHLAPAIPTMPSFGDWLALHFPDDTSPHRIRADTDHDGISNLFEYLLGTSPTVPNSPTDAQVRVRRLGDRLELSLATSVGWTDVQLELEESSDLVTWNRVGRGFDLTATQESADRLHWAFSIPTSSSDIPRIFYRITASAFVEVDTPGIP